MIYFVKNVVEGFEEIDYNDGVRKVFLYAGGEGGGSKKLKSLLSYIRNSREENATDTELKQLHTSVEQLRKNREIGVKYMRMQDFLRYERMDARKEGYEEGREEGMQAGMQAGIEKGLEQGLEQGLEKMAKLTRMLLEENQYDELKRATEDEVYCQELFKQYGIGEDK